MTKKRDDTHPGRRHPKPPDASLYRKRDREISDFLGEKSIFTNNVYLRNDVADPRGAPQNSIFGKWVLQIAN